MRVTPQVGPFARLPLNTPLGSLQVTTVGVLPHVNVERRHLWQVMQRESDC